MVKKMALSEAIVHYAVKDQPLKMTEVFIYKINTMVRNQLQEVSREYAKNLLIDTPLLEDYGYPMEKEETEVSGQLADAIESVIAAVEENGLDNVVEAMNHAAYIHGCKMEELETWMEEALSGYHVECVDEASKKEDFENITYQPYGESLLSAVRESLKTDTEVMVQFEDRTAAKISPIEAGALLEVYKELSIDNKLYFVESASKNIQGFRKIVGFVTQTLKERGF